MLTQRNCYVIGHTTKCGAADLSLPDGQRLATNTYVLCQPFNCVRFVRPTSTPLADDKDPLWKARRGRGDFRAPLLATPLLWLVIFAVLLGSGPAAAQTPANASPGGEAAPLPPPDEGSTPSSPSHSAAPPTTAVMSTRRPRHDTILSYYLDLDIDGGLSWEISGDRAVGLGRVRVGLLTMMQVRNRPAESPILMSLGATYGLSVFSPAEVGVEMEITHLKTGFWGQAGAAVDIEHSGGIARLAAGWSILGIEAQRRLVSFDDPARSTAGFLFGAKLRAPIGVLLIALLGK